MTVKELIEKLEQFPKDVQVYLNGGWITWQGIPYGPEPGQVFMDTGVFHVAGNVNPAYEGMFYQKDGRPSGCVVMNYDSRMRWPTEDEINKTKFIGFNNQEMDI